MQTYPILQALGVEYVYNYITNNKINYMYLFY